MITDSLGALSPLTSDSGIQGLKAILTVSILGDDVTPKQASRVTEVVVNVMNKSGKVSFYLFMFFVVRGHVCISLLVELSYWHHFNVTQYFSIQLNSLPRTPHV